MCTPGLCGKLMYQASVSLGAALGSGRLPSVRGHEWERFTAVRTSQGRGWVMKR